MNKTRPYGWIKWEPYESRGSRTVLRGPGVKFPGLLTTKDQELKKEVHSFMCVYNSDQLNSIDIRKITQEHETALTEAFYHAKEALEAEDLFKLFISVSDPFNKAAFWQLITPIYEEMLQILEAELGQEHPYVATTLNNLAILYKSMGDYEKALPLYQRALEVAENVPDQQHSYVATLNNLTRLTNLAGLYEIKGNHEKALIFYQRALEIIEKVPDQQNPIIAITLRNDENIISIFLLPILSLMVI